MTTIADVAEALQDLFGPEANQLARSSGWQRRERNWNGAQFVQTLVFGYLASPAASLTELSQSAATAGVVISRQGIDQRCNAVAARFLHQVLAQALQHLIAAEPVAASLLARFEGIYLLDSTVVTLPTALADLWPGCGGRTATTSKAAVKLSVMLDLCTGALDGPCLHAGRTHDRLAASDHRALPLGALRVADLGYFQLDELAAMDQTGIGFVTRYKSAVALFSPDGQRLDLVRFLKQHGQMALDQSVRLGSKHRLACRLVSVPVPEAVVAQRRARLTAEAEDKHQSVSAIRWELARWTIYLTNVDAQRLSVDEVLVLAICRWQIELLFKLWKSSGLLDEWRSQEPWRILCELYAKLLAMLVQHWLMLVGCWHELDRSWHQAAQVIRKQAFNLLSHLSNFDALTHALTDVCRGLAHCRVTGSRRKPSTAARIRSGTTYVEPS